MPPKDEKQIAVELAEAVRVLQEHGKDLTVHQLWRMFLSLRLGVIVGIGAALVSLAGGAFALGGGFQGQSSQRTAQAAIERTELSGILNFNGEFAHTDMSPWIVPFTRYLEAPEYAVVKLQTKPFATPTESFRLEVEPFDAKVAAGLAFRFAADSSTPLLQPLTVDYTGDTVRVSVPRLEQGERILLLLRVAAKQPDKPLDPNRAVILKASK